MHYRPHTILVTIRICELTLHYVRIFCIVSKFYKLLVVSIIMHFSIVLVSLLIITWQTYTIVGKYTCTLKTLASLVRKKKEKKRRLTVGSSLSYKLR